MRSAGRYFVAAFVCLLALRAAGQAPVISSFSPTSGQIGTPVTIHGANFSSSPANNIVYFGGVRAVVTTAATTSLVVTVPAGATYQPITVTTAGLTGASGRSFLVAFGGGRTFQSDGLTNFSTDRGQPWDLVVGDLDGDGKLDIGVTATFPLDSGQGGGIAGFGLFQNTSTPGAGGSFGQVAPLYPYHSDQANEGPRSQAIADLDGDGKLDLILSAYPNFLLIYRNIGVTGTLNAASFADPVVINLSANGYGLAVVDLDGDGRPEIVVSVGGTILVFQNLSSVGTINSNSFASPVSFASPPGTFVSTLVIADFDLDGKPDIAALLPPGGPNLGSLALLRNTSTGPGINNGTFAGPVVLNIGGGFYGGFAAGDIDGDGRTDLVIIMRGYSVPTTISILRNLTSGPGLTTNSFERSADLSGPRIPNDGAVALGDMNGDGKADLVALFRNDTVDSSFRVFINNGSPGIIDAYTFDPGDLVSVATDYPPVGLVLADVDGDGKPEIVLPRYAGNGGYTVKGYVTVYHNSTPPPPSAFPAISILAPTNGATFIAPINLALSVDAKDSDGTVTQVLFYAGTNLIGTATEQPFGFTWTNAFAGSYRLTAKAVDNSGGYTISAAANITIDNQAAPVIESFTPTSGRIGTSVTITGRNFGGFVGQNVVYFGGVRADVTSNATNSLIVTVPAGATYQPITVTTAGLTGASGRSFLVTFGGGPSFQTDGRTDFRTFNGAPSSGLVVGDLDGDGKQDVAIRIEGFAGFGLFQNTSAPGTSGGLGQMLTLYPASQANQNAQSQAIADLDGDGKLDLILAGYPNFLIIYRNISSSGTLSAASFADPVAINVSGVADGLAVADVDGDGRPEIVAAIGGAILVFRNLSSPGIITSNSFASPVSFAPPPGTFVTALVIADFDLDGKLDICGLLPPDGLNPGCVLLLRNISAGPNIDNDSFASPVILNVGPGSYMALAAGDIDGDGRPDLLILRAYSDPTTISILRNLTSGPGLTTNSFSQGVDLPGPQTPNGGAIALADMNGDGKVDLVALFRHDTIASSFRVFINNNSPGAISASLFAPSDLFSVPTDYPPLGLALSDIDGDGKPDVLLTRYASSGLYSVRGYLTVYHNSTPPPPNKPPTISIISPTNGSVFVTPVDITVSVDAHDIDGSVTQVLLHAGSDLVGASASSPFTITWSNVLAGDYTLTATALDDSTNATVSAGVDITVNSPPVRPSITVPPQSQSAVLGSNATFTVTASGTAPLAFHWLFNGTNPLSTASANLTLTNVQFSQTGDYSVYVSNSAGSVTSNPARLTVVPPGGRLVQAMNSSGTPGSTVRVPIIMVGQGDENAVGFSLGFPNSLSYVTAELGGGATDAILNVNPAQAASGRLGVSLALSAGASFPAGTQELVVVTFAIASEIGNTAAAVSFGDQPLAREISDALANSLPGIFAGSTVTISGGGYEADVSPAPDGNGVITVTDWVKVGRYAAGLDTVSNASQFQRADCAPRSTLGNGAITITDWVQAGRYAAGLDPLTSAGGPTGPSGGFALARFGLARIAMATSTRELRASKTAIYPGQTNRLSVVLVAQGNESAVGFSISFDPAVATFVSASAGASAGGAIFNVNSSQAASGRIGVVLSLPIGTAFATGTQELAAVRFAAANNAIGTSTVAFGDQPVTREVSDVLANSVSAIDSDGTLQIVPSLRISPAGENHLLSWPSWAGNFVLEASDVLSPASIWTAPSALETNVVGSEIQIITPPSPDRRFFRLRLP